MHKPLEQLYEENSADLRALRTISLFSSSLTAPMYIARGPAAGNYHRSVSDNLVPPFYDIEDLTVRDLYCQAYPDDPMRSFNGCFGQVDDELYNACRQLYNPPEHTKRLIQRPWHDAESAILVFLLHLLRAKPKDSVLEDPDSPCLLAIQRVYETLRNTRIGAEMDPRYSFLNSMEIMYWVHEKLTLPELHATIEGICKALKFGYEFLIPQESIIQEVVLHENFQRLLFELYCKLKEKPDLDEQFEPGKLRPLGGPYSEVDPAISKCQESPGMF
jgi:hypothetical protein